MGADMVMAREYAISERHRFTDGTGRTGDGARTGGSGGKVSPRVLRKIVRGMYQEPATTSSLDLNTRVGNGLAWPYQNSTPTTSFHNRHHNTVCDAYHPYYSV